MLFFKVFVSSSKLNYYITLNNLKPTSIFNYDFDWPSSTKKKGKKKCKEKCCKKYKKKEEKKCKNCPKRIV